METSAPLRSASTGAAWLSSARVVRCWVKSRNERNSRSQLPAVRPGTLGGLPALSRRKVGTTSSHHGPYVQGDTRATMPGTARRELARGSQSPKAGLSSDCRLQLDGMKPESLVIAGQQHRGECVPEPCTHRPSSHERSGGGQVAVLTLTGGKPLTLNGQLGLSRNKVTVGEPAVGSPPF